MLFVAGVALELEAGVALERSVVEIYLNGLGLSRFGASGLREIIFNIFANPSCSSSS